MHGEPALPPGFDHPRYANPTAPKGGRLTQGVLGTFDSLNPFIVKGLALSQIRGYVVESLLARGYDEPFTLYGLLARTVETDADRTYVTFALDPAAKFSDGKPVTAEDVIFSWQLLRDKGRPNFRTYYVKVAKAEALSERVVRFDLTGANDRELPLILGLMPVLAKHAINPDTFEDTTLRADRRQRPLCGRQGRSRPQHHAEARSELLGPRPRHQPRPLEFRRGPLRLLSRRQFASRGLQEGPLRRAHRDRSRPLGDRLRRARGARRPHRQGDLSERPAEAILRPRLQHPPADLLPTFACARRSACCSTSNGSTTISSSIATSARRATSRAPSFRRAAGRRIRARARAARAVSRRVRADIMDGTWQPPVTDGSGRDRDTLKRALALLDAAGYALDGTVLRSRATRQPLQLRDPGHHQGSGAAGARLLARPQARRHRRARPRGRRRAIRPAATHLRLRHDRIPLGPVALARQRAGVLLGLGRGRRRRHAQLHGRQKRRDRRHDRGAAEGARARRIRRRRARARSRADVGLLRRAALSSAGAVGRALDHDRASGRDLAVRLSAGNLVARAEPE